MLHEYIVVLFSVVHHNRIWQILLFSGKVVCTVKRHTNT